MPFLFKILSVGKALSIQAHPDAALARELHSQWPQVYKDPNHKPEIAIALSSFEALCGFRSFKQLAEYIKSVPELEMMCGRDAINGIVEANERKATNKAALKVYFAALMNCPKETVIQAISSFKERMKNSVPSELERVCLRLEKEYPEEVGCFCVFLLNHLCLEPGQAVFLAANEPHAYLRGECVECMALSDNVVRAGLTPKFRDLPTLLEMLTYTNYTPDQILFKPRHLGSPSIAVYEPPVSEFAVIRMEVAKDPISFSCPSNQHAILIVVEGEISFLDAEIVNGIEKEASFGKVLLLPPRKSFNIAARTEKALAFVAFAPNNKN